MIQIYQSKAKAFFFPIVLLFTVFFCSSVSGQILSTAGGTNYGALSRVDGTAGAITFLVENANAQGRILSKIDCAVLATHTNNTYKLWYSATSLSGQPTVAEPAWTLITTGDPISAATDGIVTVLDNINFAIPGNTQYRFALTTDNGIRYTGTTAGTPNPNTFTSGGFSLKVGSFQIGGASVGYGGAFTAITNSPRYFTGVVYISPCPSTTSASVPTITGDTVVCGEGSPVTLRVINGNLNNAANWKWYTGGCGTGTAIGTGTSVTVSPTANTTYYVRGEGGCAAAPGNCASVVVTVRTKPGNPIIDPVAPICLGDLAHLQMNPVTLGTTPIPDSITVTSSLISLVVPDNTEDGVNASLTVPALPFGSQMTGIDVTMSLTHTYPGDMIINLKAPNGSIANLYKYNTGTFAGDFGNMPNAGWFNGVTSSAGNTVYSSVDSPYRYNAGPLFIPDLINAVVAGPAVQNPTGFASTAAAMADLYSTPSGTWTLALADGGPGDIGTLTRWSIKIKYNKFAQIPATPGIWTPGNGTLFTDAAGTIAYDGTTPRLDIYAKPATTAVYAATSSIGGCNSEAVNTTVTVNIPAAVTGDVPSAVSICNRGTTTFSITASGTNPAYQWQTDNGTGTFADIADGDNYSGTSTNTLTVKDIPATWDGYKYVCIVSSTAPCSQSVSSRAVILTVNPTPAVSLGTDGVPTHLLPGMIAPITVTSSPAGAAYTWFKNSDTLFDATGSVYNATIDNQGIYKVSVVDVNGCTNTTNTIEIADSVSNRLFIYPNPSQNGQFSVSYYSLKNNILPRVLTIYDSKGALVLKQSYTLFKPYDKMNVDFARLSRGVYFVNLLDRSGKRLATGKLVVE
jgi:subtilisin-like proprotein convertase family protein